MGKVKLDNSLDIAHTSSAKLIALQEGDNMREKQLQGIRAKQQVRLTISHSLVGIAIHQPVVAKSMVPHLELVLFPESGGIRGSTCQCLWHGLMRKLWSLQIIPKRSETTSWNAQPVSQDSFNGQAAGLCCMVARNGSILHGESVCGGTQSPSALDPRTM